MFGRFLWIIGLAIAGAATWFGLPYYLTPFAERPFSPLDELYSPTGLLGQGYGIIGSLMILIAVVLYSLRKRTRLLGRIGKMSDWLNFHIFLCLLGPFLVLLHTTFKFGGFVAISFWSMTIVVISGVFGRYVYVWIPKTINGQFLGAEEMREKRDNLLSRVESQTGLASADLYAMLQPSRKGADNRRQPPPKREEKRPRPPVPEPAPALGAAARSIDALFKTAGSAAPSTSATLATASGRDSGDRRKVPRPGPDRRGRERHPGLFRAIGESVAFRLTARRQSARLARELAAAGVPEPARSQIAIHLQEERRMQQQLRLLHPFQRAFRYWHAFHLPLAAV
ncbi:MAG: hypothetical protein OEN00_12525, partial [Gemmatimonadota bacterium]|nr:hypothetical protein [Gemmatimonadota bacterium]